MHNPEGKYQKYQWGALLTWFRLFFSPILELLLVWILLKGSSLRFLWYSKNRGQISRNEYFCRGCFLQISFAPAAILDFFFECFEMCVVKIRQNTSLFGKILGSLFRGRFASLISKLIRGMRAAYSNNGITAAAVIHCYHH